MSISGVYTAIQDSFLLVKYIKLIPLLAFQRPRYTMNCMLLHEYGVQLPGKYTQTRPTPLCEGKWHHFRTLRVRTNPDLINSRLYPQQPPIHQL